ncbi:helix-turn-helix domain-containing protein [Nocardia sp. 348MFTsu5.1]|uniref:helix-turn-helix domain-containing protein n=1 Tax=Nocardia sp. 348MFTsu5.1 TaxID=1172185 RepID=UPI000382BF9D|nr:helix-turn-helix domain-containing protein [Nocardia sp. 348MFTsu5.1]
MTTANFLSAEEVADELGLHVRTIRAYIRDGRLRAARVGKQYRITRPDLEAFVTGVEPNPTVQIPAPQTEGGLTAHSTVVIDFDNIGADDSDRIITVLNGAVGGRSGVTPLRLTAAPDRTRRSLKVIAQGSISDTTDVLTLLRDITEGGNFS